MKLSLKLPRGGASESTESSSHITKRNSCPQEKAPPSGELARKRLRGSYNTTYRRTPK